ncbi:DNA-(apurinic or apyrimidinic site) endonuclease 2-like isoform X2 [Penaeus japonicus]|uniref:DNA-(apurinic or apyrimidinic site) endonuclease 2-like isoform X2 n=1 Tax=Penaeus japonicus TaxID=27405 RepID=UPI001C711C7C|nr:DNA-(apurinic or apyrimidinic site) endonuclease 2-like isoform X2 [Penaeus japonicus]
MGDMLEEPQAIVEGYSSYFSFSRKKSGYSGVATFCSQRTTPTHAQEGLTGKHAGELFDGGGTVEVLPGRWKDEELKNLDSEGRAVITQHLMKDTDGKEIKIAVINVYCPHVDPEKPERRIYKIRFYELLRQRAAAIRDTGCHVIIVGDINTSHKRIDHCDPDDSEDFENRLGRRYLDMLLLPIYKNDQQNETSGNHHKVEGIESVQNDHICSSEPGMIGEVSKIDDSLQLVKTSSSSPSEESDDSRVDVNNKMREDEGYVGEQQSDEALLSSSTNFQVVDTFRYFYPQREKAFTCWHTLSNSRATNYGTRIDYIFCDKDFLTYLRDAMVQQEVLGSDHCPVSIVIMGEITPAAKLPSSCTKFYPEFQGQQQKLSSYFQRKSSITDCQAKTSQNTTLQSTGSTNETWPQSGVKRKPEVIKKSTSKKLCTEKQKKLSSFFTIKQSSLCDREKASIEQKEGNEEPLSTNQNHNVASFVGHNNEEVIKTRGDSQSISSQELLLSQKNTGDSVSGSEIDSNKPLTQVKNTGWNFLMKGPKPPPTCSGHNEPAALRTVKKKGPNMNRQFYTCARGAGKEGDPEAQCNFFKWVGK